ncbi:MAG: 50S ribosomal protein L21 [Candidatus Omnitrophica bacterium]|nr:50S ribosomal protein L21 [Candidatus Omnitrophota bacterium]
MYAVIDVGGKQQIVRKGDEVLFELFDNKGDKEITLDRVLLISDGKKVEVGTPYVAGATVVCAVKGETKGEKVIIYKFKKRKSHKKKTGHRQKYLKVAIKAIHSAKKSSTAKNSITPDE